MMRDLMMGLAAMLAIAMIMLFWALYRANLFSQRLMMLVLTVFPLLSLSFYYGLGNPMLAQRHGEGSLQQQADMQALMIDLATRLRNDPKNVEDRLLLAQSYMTAQDYSNAVATYRELVLLAPQDVAMMLSLVEALTAEHQGMFTAEADGLLGNALALEPDNVLTLWLLGVSAQQKGNSQVAADFFRRMEVALPQDSPISERVRAKLNQLVRGQ